MKQSIPYQKIITVYKTKFESAPAGVVSLIDIH